MWLGGADLQQAVLAGGVAAGAVGEFDMTSQSSPIVIGVVTGAVCVLGFRHLSAFFEAHFNLHDSQGVHNLHGLPSLLGALVAATVCMFTATPDSQNFHISEDSWKSQLIAIAVTLGISLAGGGIAGAVMRLVPQPIEASFNDAQWFNTRADADDCKVHV